MNVGTLENFVPSGNKRDSAFTAFGERAAEIIHIGQAIMEMKGGGNTIILSPFTNHLTMAEVIG